jgi:hypothetical protein
MLEAQGRDAGEEREVARKLDELNPEVDSDEYTKTFNTRDDPE